MISGNSVGGQTLTINKSIQSIGTEAFLNRFKPPLNIVVSSSSVTKDMLLAAGLPDSGSYDDGDVNISGLITS